MTWFHVSSDDTNGTLKAYVGEGDFTDDPYAMDGASPPAACCGS
ncbi:hypothetical protein [Mesobaculum littorinae]|nr:hypothetical protein [Mesobaculum littorinae]